jgi:hypothetical protein
MAIADLVRSWRDEPSSTSVLYRFREGGDGMSDKLRADAARGSDAGYLDAGLCEKLGDTVCGILGFSDPKQVATVLLVLKALGITVGAKGMLDAPIALIALAAADVGPSLSNKWRQSRKLRCAGVIVRRRSKEFSDIDAFTVSDALVMCAVLANSEGARG